MIYEIKFDHGQSNIYCSGESGFMCGDLVLVELKKYRVSGKIARLIDSPAEDLLVDGKVSMKLSSADLSRLENIKEDSKSAKVKIKDLIKKHKLEMKLVEVSYTFDYKQLFISFMAEHRVDFRALLKDLADEFHVRIELRQIGVRDGAKVLGGLGPCGRPLCCSEFMGEFPVVSIKMAKNQSLSLNQNKLSGLCGRLMCCLSYEDEFYREAKQIFPDYGQNVKTIDGVGRVVGYNIVNNTVSLSFKDKNLVKEYALLELEGVHG